ncbi:MAG: FG-GAP-like repeat-containing protein [Planctomycetota bacterium]|nr:FG-GAP-like repeat-containing protein [Planctomycetota bacterium]
MTGTTVAFLVGWTSGGFDTSYNGGGDAFVAKLSPSGGHLWSTYLGGDWNDDGYGIAVDSAGNVLVTGVTGSTGWISGGFDTSYNGGTLHYADAFVAKLSPSGGHLWSTYLGGTDWDGGRGIAVDSAGNVLVTGYTLSAGWTSGGFDTSFNGFQDAFVAKLSPSGGHLWSTYLGGDLSYYGYGYGIAVDSAGSVLVGGSFNDGYVDVCVVKLSSSGSRLWSTNLSGTDWKEVHGIAVDSAGTVLVTGYTLSAGWTSGGFDTSYNGGDWDAFVAKLSPSGGHLWSTYLGGTSFDSGEGIAVDSAGNILVTGMTRSASWTSGGFDTSYNGVQDAFVAKLSPSGGHLWSTYLGGTDGNAGCGIAVDSAGNVLVTGDTGSAGWTSGGFDTSYNGGDWDAFVAKIRDLGTAGLLPDLAIANDQVILTSEGTAVRVVVTVDNRSGLDVNGPIEVRFRDAKTKTPVGTQSIASILAWGGKSTSVLWNPSGPDAMIEVEVDPFDRIRETTNLNNKAVAALGSPGSLPLINKVQAQYDQNGDPAIFGQFISGISAWNTFRADVVNPSGNAKVDHVAFTLGTLPTFTDWSGADGWSVGFDMGKLTGDTTLTVVAYDAQNHASAPWRGTVKVIPAPSWADVEQSKFVGGSRAYYDLNGWKPQDWKLEADFPNDWKLIGGLENHFQAGLLIHTAAGLDGRVMPSESKALLGVQTIVFGKELSLFKDASFTPGSNRPWYVPKGVSFGFDLPTFRPTFDTRLEIAGAAVTVSGSVDSDVVNIPLGKVPFSLGVWPMSLEASLKVTPGFDWAVTVGVGGTGGLGILQPPTYFRPKLDVSLQAKVNLVDVGVASVGAYVEPTFAFRYEVGLLDAVPGFDHDAYVEFTVAVGAEVTVGPWTYNLGEITVAGPYNWGTKDYGAAGEGLAATGQSRFGILAMPDILSLVNGHQLRAYVAQDDASSATRIVYQTYDGTTWSDVMPLSDDSGFCDSAPRLAVRPDGKIVAVWTRVKLTAAQLAAATFEQVLAAQDIYSAEFDGTSWTTPLPLSNNGVADGNAIVAFGTNGTGLAMWVTDANGTLGQGSGNEIAYTVWDGNAWAAPANLTSNAVADRSVDLAYTPNGAAVAVWAQATDGSNTGQTPYYAMWNGSAWSTPEAIPGSAAAEIRSIRAASLSDGRVVALWAELGDDGFILRSAVRSAAGVWSAPELAATGLSLVDGLQLKVNDRDTVFGFFHGAGTTEAILCLSRDFGQSAAGWTVPVAITDDAGTAWMPAGAINADGDLFVIYATAAVAPPQNATGMPRALAAETGSPFGMVSVSAGPDLGFVADSFGLSDPSLLAGQQTTLVGTVVNVGHETSAATSVQFYLGDPAAGGTLLGQPVAVGELLPDGTALVSSDSFTLTAGENVYAAVIVAVAGEATTDDNSAKVTIESASPDVTGPQVTADLPSSGFLPEGSGQLVLLFNEPVAYFAETHLSLVESTLGVLTPDQVYLAADSKSAMLMFEGGIPVGSYTLKASDDVTDIFGNRLDGDKDGQAGGDYTTTFVVTGFPTTIDQAESQADPTKGSSIHFTAVFGQPVADFSASGVTLSGTAPGTLVAIISPSGIDGTTYDIAVRGMTGSGTVIVGILAGVAHDATGMPNNAATSADAVVTYDVTPPMVSIGLAEGQAEPCDVSPIHFRVVFSEPVSDFAVGDLVFGGTASETLVATVGPVGAEGTTYAVAVTGMTGRGTVTARIPAGAAHDAAGNASGASTSTDPVVSYDFTLPMVTSTFPSLSDGTLAAGTNALQITFSKHIVHGESAANYQLQTVGPDGLLGTADDTTIPVTVACDGIVATLNFGPLSESVYRFSVRETITDAAGNALDGNADGVAGGDWTRDFVAVAADEERFVSAPTYPTSPYGYLQAVATADFNGDGFLDLVVAGGESITLCLGDGVGGFQVAGTIASGAEDASAVAVGNFNSDGKADLAVADPANSTILVLLNNGRGGFAAPLRYASSGIYPQAIAVGDFNGDGKADLAVANDKNVGVLFGNGTGGFGGAVTYASGGWGSRSVAVADFNADGNADLVVANYDNIAMLLGDGTGGFAAAVSYPSGGSQTNAMTVSDFNGDGKADVAVAIATFEEGVWKGNVGVLLGDGSGGFGAAVSYASGEAYPSSVTVGDFNGDGKADLAVAGNDQIGVLEGDGQGGFGTAMLYASGGSGARSLAVGDFNADERADVAVANWDSVGVLLGSDTGGFLAAVSYFLGSASPAAVTAGDFNTDGKTDLVVVNGGANTVGVLLGIGGGLFAPPMVYTTGGSYPRSVVVADYNSDGKLDVAVTNTASRTIGVLLGNGKGGFAPAVLSALGDLYPWSVAAGDFNGDGKADLAVMFDGATGNLGVLLGDGQGGFAAPVIYATGGARPSSLAVGDFNGDEKDDLVVAHSSTPGIVGVLLGDGTGRFAEALICETGGSYALSVAVGDFNVDGKADLVVTNSDSNNIGILLGIGTGGFAPALTYASRGRWPSFVTVGDLNSDGKADLAVTNDDGIEVSFGTGTAGFTGTVSYAVNGWSATIADFDGDGKGDLAVINSETVGVLLGDGAGRFAAARIQGSGSVVSSLSVADFNADGKVDVVAAHGSDSEWVEVLGMVEVLLGNGTGALAEAASYATGGFNPSAVAISDFNGDGKADLAVAHATESGTVGVLLGDGAGGFAEALTYATDGSHPSSLAVGDFNGDGHADLAVANAGGIGVLSGTDTGTFAPAVTYASGGFSPSSVKVGDFNGDGWLDLAVAHTSGDASVGVLLNNRVGGFDVAKTFRSGGSGPKSLAVGDFNADGKPDLAVANTNSRNVVVLRGDGAGGLAPAVTYATGNISPTSLAVADFTGDGQADLAVGDLWGSGTGVLFGNGAGGFRPMVTYATTGAQIATGDFNSDGQADMVVSIGGGVCLLLNSPGQEVRTWEAPQAMQVAVQSRGFGAGQLVGSSGKAFDGAGRLEVAGQTFAPQVPADFLTDEDRTLVTAMVTIAGLQVHREITVPGTGNEAFARTLDVFENPSKSPITTTVRIVGNLGSNGDTTVFATSDGDDVVEPTDQWIGTDDADGSGTPAIVHYVHGPAGLVPTSVLRTSDNIEWTYTLRVPAGQMVRLAYLTILATRRADAVAAAQTLVGTNGLSGQTAAFLSQDERNSIANFAFNPWHNAADAYDVDGNGSVVPLDVLTIIIYINGRSGDTSLPTDPAGVHPFYDTNDDNACTPLDVLAVISYINSHLAGFGEGEMAASTAEVTSLPSLVGAPFGAAVPMFPAAAELWTEAASTALGKEFPRPAWLQGTSPREVARRMQIPVGSATEYHFADTLLDDHTLFELDGVLRDIAPEIAKCNYRG